MSTYLDAARQAAERIWARQAAHLAGSPSEPRVVTISRATGPTWCSVALREGGRYELYPVPEQPMEMEPTRLDYAAWSWMERLSARSGDPAWARRVDDMADLFAVYGFDPRSGLAYIGAQAQFDVVNLGPCGTQAYAVPNFKPAANFPMERLWRHAPRQTERMCRAAFYGLITRPETMDFNRYCYYGSDDRLRRPFLRYDPQHVAFAQTASFLIHWWATHAARTGSLDTLRWLEAMADKWLAAQSPATGLVPHWFGVDRPDSPTQDPRPYCNSGDTMTAVAFLEAARVLKAWGGSPALAGKVFRLGLNLARGLARHGYEEARDLFPSWMRLADGRPDTDVIIYAFPTERQKEEAVRVEPRCAQVSVYGGAGYFAAGPWSYGSGNPAPYDLARMAELSGDAEVLACCRAHADRIMRAAESLGGPLTPAGQWTCDARASYARMMLVLARLTGEPGYVARARALMDRELPVLAAPPEGRPEWWRHSFRNAIMEALLDLDEASA